MLSFLKISNLAIVDEVTLEPGSGLNVLTGETGAGKSIIVDAIALLLGERGSIDLIRTGADRLAVEGLFDLSGRSDVPAILHLAGDEREDSPELVVRRELTVTGGTLKSRAFLNGRLVTLSTLRRAGEMLGDLHGQHQHQSLLRLDEQRDALDRVAGTWALREETGELFGALKNLETEREELAGRERERARQEEILNRQIEEIAATEPKPGEEEELRREESLLRHATEIALIADETNRLLGEDDDSALSRLAGSSERLARLAAIDPDAERTHALVEEARVAVEEACGSLSRYLGADESEGVDPARLEQVAARLAELQRLQRKYGPTVEAVLSFHESAVAELESLSGAEERLDELEKEIEELRSRYIERARALSKKRRTAATSFARRVEKELSSLAMGGTRVEIRVDAREGEAGPCGFDAIEFHIAPNAGEEPRPLTRIASGGELSRLMLAVRNAAGSSNDRRTLIFDEVDSGVGGRTAEAVGQRLAQLAHNQQVFCVTHLPQIAAFAGHHYQVSKKTLQGRTTVRLLPLDQAGRIDELARMIGGGRSDTARRHAAAMVGRGEAGGARSGRRIVS